MEEKVIVWKRLTDYNSVEHCLVTASATDITISSAIAGTVNEQAFSVNYSLLLDSGWNGKEVYIEYISDGTPRSWHYVNIAGGWLGGTDKQPLHCDCIDIDITVTPFTNSLPINRLKLQPGQTAQIEMLYFDVMAQNVLTTRQIYTCINEQTYKFEVADGSFTAELTIDSDGIITSYPGLFERIYSYTQ